MQALGKINPKQPRRCQLRENQLEIEPQVCNKNLICIKLVFMEAYIGMDVFRQLIPVLDQNK